MTRLWLACWLAVCAVAQNCTALEGGVLPSGFCARRMLATLVREPRGLVVVDDGLLVLDRSPPEQVRLLVDNNGDGMYDAYFIIVRMAGMTHGLAVHKGFIYASSDTTVWRWRFAPGQRNETTTNEVVIQNMNANGQGGAPRGHTTRTLVFDSQDRLYISVGSGSNLDVDSSRARIRRFPLPAPLPPTGIDFLTGEVFADGLRNEVGMAIDRHGVLWGVENSCDDLSRVDLGGDIHNQNPAEELNRFPECCAGAHYGYPRCFTEFQLPAPYGQGMGTLWAHPSYMTTTNDSWCRANTVAPALSLQAHSAPLSIAFFNATAASSTNCSGGFPAWMDGDAFIAYHGSWNRPAATGYKVVRVPMTLSGFPRSRPLNFFCRGASQANWESGLRPVQVAFDRCNRLVLSSDGTTPGPTGAGIILITWNCQTCPAGVTNSSCCDFSHSNLEIPPEGSCPGCRTPYPEREGGQDGVWRTSIQCAEIDPPTPDPPPTQAPTPTKAAAASSFDFLILAVIPVAVLFL